MANDPMTLLERLRNPAWHGSGFTHGQPAELDVKQTVADMAEAADMIETLQSQLKIEEGRTAEALRQAVMRRC